MTDAELLAQHHAGAADAFAAIVRRHVDWVHGVARRRVGEDAALADDVVQATFLALAQQSRRLRPDTVLPAWLFRVACHASARAVRDRHRRARHERQAAMIDRRDAPNAEWAALAPAVDALVGQLRQGDREAIVLRFYRQMSHAEVGRALGVGEEAARKRVDRAVDRLREMAAQRGIAVGATATFAALLATGLTPSPAAAGTVAVATTAAGTKSTAVAGNAATLAKGAIAMSTATKATAVAAIAILTIGGATMWRATTAATRAPSAPTTSPAAPTTRAAPVNRDLVRSASNLRMIGQAVFMYADANGRVNPPSLGATLSQLAGPNDSPSQRRAAATIFVMPGEVAPADATPDWVNENAAVVFLAQGCDVDTLLDGPDRRIVALHGDLDRPFAHGGDEVVNVGFIDGSVTTMTLAEADAAIERSKPVLDAARQMAATAPADRVLVRTQSKLHQLGRALLLAANARGGRYPATLGASLPWTADQRVDSSPQPFLFLTPPDREALPTFDPAGPSTPPSPEANDLAAWIDAHTSFDYLAANAPFEGLQADTAIAHTRLAAPLVSSSGVACVCVLFADGHSESVSIADASALIERSRTTIDAARAQKPQ